MDKALIAPEKLVKAGLASPDTAAQVAAALDEACQKFNIVTGPHLAAFLAQCSHESCGFRVTKENLNYGAHNLFLLFPKYFNAAQAAAYSRQQERIASRIYANRMGNGPEATRDGWTYRGRGFIQLTGKANYAAFSKAVGKDVVANPDLVAGPEYAALSAAWFWAAHNLNALADTPGVQDETKVINGGTHGLAERQRLYDKAIKVFV